MVLPGGAARGRAAATRELSTYALPTRCPIIVLTSEFPGTSTASALSVVTLYAISAIRLRPRDAMSASCLPKCYAMSGTELGNGAAGVGGGGGGAQEVTCPYNS
eukprot:51777-Rhodomonas_salina.2